MLTEKAKEDFNKWLYSVYFKEYYNYQMIWQLMGETARNAVIIEWFDSVEIYISTIYCNLSKGFDANVICEGHQFNSGSHDRGEANEIAITKANEIYNNN